MPGAPASQLVHGLLGIVAREEESLAWAATFHGVSNESTYTGSMSWPICVLAWRDVCEREEEEAERGDETRRNERET